MSDSSEDCVIEGTPVRKKTKKKKYRPKPKKKANVFPVENNPTVELNKCPITNNKSQCDINNVCNDITESIHRTTSKNRYNHYVFYTVEEILKFSVKCFPTNNWVHMVGIYIVSTDLNCPVLCSTTTIYNKQAEVKLQFPPIVTIPKEGKKIIVYGFLNFDSNLPIIYVNFCQVCDVNYKAYIKVMLELRTTVPLDNFTTESVLNETISIDQTLLPDSRNEFSDKFEGLEETLKDTSITDSQLCTYFDNIL